MVKKIGVSQAPDKLSYNVGDYFNPAGLKIKVTYDNGSGGDIVKEIAYNDSIKSKFTFSPTLETTLSHEYSKVEISYGGKSVEQAITFADKLLTEIAIKTAPTKTSYIEGQSFDPTGLVITVSYDSGVPEDIPYSENSGITFTPTEGLTVTDNVITFTYREKTVT